MTDTEKYVAVEVNAFGRGMQTMFQGIADIFASMGINSPKKLEEQSRKWSPDEKGSDEEHASKAAPSVSSVSAEFSGDADSDAGASNVKEAENENAAEPITKKPVKKPNKKAAEEAENTSLSATTGSVSQDDITRIIVQKIKQNRSNNEKIGEILKSYGAAKVSDLSPSQYEAFITDLTAI